MFRKKFFSVRTTDDSVNTPTARPNLFEHVVHKIKKAFTNPFTSEKTALHQKEQNAQDGKTIGSPVQSLQAIELAAAKKKLADLEATYVQRKLECANYRQRVERMNLSGCIKTLTGDRDLFKARLKRAEQELVLKTEERSKMEQEWREESERRLWAQLRVLGAKRGLEDSGKEYAALEAKFLELQSRSDSLHDEVDDEAPDSQGSAADDGSIVDWTSSVPMAEASTL
ncbi:hypothetical protein FRC00_003683 [Tulasnella sp. 408]|nr:hypothetical protein FRC00_003683 [Tulasnella sp. 408]